MEGPMKKRTLPKTDSIQKLAEFWDTHDLTDFEEQLCEVGEPVFARVAGSMRSSGIQVPLRSREAKAVERIAHAKGLSPQQLLRQWVLQRLPPPDNGRQHRQIGRASCRERG